MSRIECGEREEHERGGERKEGERLIVALGQVPKNGKLSVKCRKRAKGDFVAREGQRGERGNEGR